MYIEECSAEELLSKLNELDECDAIEAKAYSTDSSRTLLETVCSMSNEPGLGGGVILLGIAENNAEVKDASGKRYFVEGVDDPDTAQLDLVTQCKSVFNSPVYPTVKVEKVHGKTVLKIIVDELPHHENHYISRKRDCRRAHTVA
ncbi:MAG: putative DNA binding domain-containing protein [Victivallales bacterium]|nr:putative DNA binding domain-containing protein [Victivallales bacterium]